MPVGKIRRELSMNSRRACRVTMMDLFTFNLAGSIRDLVRRSWQPLRLKSQRPSRDGNRRLRAGSLRCKGNRNRLNLEAVAKDSDPGICERNDSTRVTDDRFRAR